jgi:hypothetical protein
MWFKSRSSKESVPTREAREGAQRAEQELKEVREQRRVVEDLAAFIAETMRRNHFGEQIERSIALRRGQ